MAKRRRRCWLAAISPKSPQVVCVEDASKDRINRVSEKQKNPAIAGVFSGGQGRDRTGDTRIFSPLLYQLSYLATIVQGLDGRGAGIRTLDPVIKSHLLYQLSYAPISPVSTIPKDWSELRDSNPRQPPWQGGTLPTELSSHLVS